MCQLLPTIAVIQRCPGVSPASMTEYGFPMDLGSERELRIDYVRVDMYLPVGACPSPHSGRSRSSNSSRLVDQEDITGISHAHHRDFPSILSIPTCFPPNMHMLAQLGIRCRFK